MYDGTVSPGVGAASLDRVSVFATDALSQGASNVRRSADAGLMTHNATVSMLSAAAATHWNELRQQAGQPHPKRSIAVTAALQRGTAVPRNQGLWDYSLSTGGLSPATLHEAWWDAAPYRGTTTQHAAAAAMAEMTNLGGLRADESAFQRGRDWGFSAQLLHEAGESLGCVAVTAAQSPTLLPPRLDPTTRTLTWKPKGLHRHSSLHAEDSTEYALIRIGTAAATFALPNLSGVVGVIATLQGSRGSATATTVADSTKAISRTATMVGYYGKPTTSPSASLLHRYFAGHVALHRVSEPFLPRDCTQLFLHGLGSLVSILSLLSRSC